MSGIRFSGLASGMDTENIIKQMMEIEKMRVTKVEKQKTKMEWKKDVWKEMNTKVFDFYKKQVFDLKSAGSFAKKNATVSDSDAMSVTAGASAVRGTHSIKVDKMAKGSFLTSGTVDEAFPAGSAGQITLSVGGTSKALDITAGDTATEFVKKINDLDLGVKASYDSNYDKIFLSTTKTGANTTISFGGIDAGDEAEFMKELGFTNNKIESTSLDLSSSKTLGDCSKINLGGNLILSNGTESKSINIKTTDTLNDIVNSINALSIGVTADGTSGSLVLNSGTGITLGIEGTNSLLTDMGVKDSGEVLGSAGQDASFTYNGALLESSTNEVSVNGLDLILKQEGMTSAATISITQDTDAIYDKVKDFVLKYNELVLDINGKVNADSARKYEPLTSEEKEAMGDDDVKLWEKKIKDSLLRRDDVLTGLSSAMRSTVVSSSGVTTTGMDYNYLSDLGITTGSYTERGILHIAGDEDDSLYGDKTNKLKEAIEKDPEKVAEFLNAIGEKLYGTMQEKMKSTTLSSALTFYNDKNMDKQVTAYESKIADLEERMAAVEARYYKQFTAMEKMIQQMNNQSSSLMGMMGGGQ